MSVRRMVEGTQVISHERQENGGRYSGDGQVRGFCRPKKHVISHDRQEIGGRDSVEGQVRGLIDRRKIRDGPPMGTRFPPPAPSLDRAR